MKTNLTKLTLVVAMALSAFRFPLSAFAQGTLTPPGAPAAGMKSLAQIEPRTPISAAPFTITVPGSYYLTTNLTTTVSNAIVILTNGVTLDLSGFTLTSTVANAANGGTAILLGSGLSDITIGNGHIRSGVTNNGGGVYSGGGFAYGISWSGNPPQNVLASRVSVVGCLNHGIALNNGNSTGVEACMVRTVGSIGIMASTIKSSSAADCGGSAIYGDEDSDCIGQSSGGGYGIYAFTSAQSCYGTSGSSYGLYAMTAENCYGISSTGTGIQARSAANCYGSTVSDYGISTYIALNCCGNSTGTGLYALLSASGCYGQSALGTGLYALNASFCTGNVSGGTAIRATMATGCSAFIGTNLITYKYNMP